MKNEEKAKNLALESAFYNTADGTDIDIKQALYNCAMLMAEWKDERVKACFILISKLIKDSVLTKDNQEHIMVEQMMELYNNLKI